MFLLSGMPFISEAYIASYVKMSINALPKTRVFSGYSGHHAEWVVQNYESMTNSWKPFYLDLLRLKTIIKNYVFEENNISLSRLKQLHVFEPCIFL